MTTETRSISFVVPAVPVSQPRQRHRIARGKNGQQFVQNYTPTKAPVNAFKAAVQIALREASNGSGPIDGPVRMTCMFVMPRPQSLVWKTRAMPRLHHAKKPDCENLVKSLQDALHGLAWRDDSQVCELVARKMVAAGDEQPHVEITIEELE